ncbi:hypothetical protein C6A37_08995, partial [Desulfobacteraceae bacterium SEEP-SAG9]
EFMSELESIIDDMMFEHQDASSGPNAQNKPPADPSEDGATNESVATEYEIEKLKETFEVSLGQAMEETDPQVDLESIFREQEDPVVGLPEFAPKKDADPETGDIAEIEKKPGKEAGVAAALKKKKITQAKLKSIPKVEDTRQAEKKARPKTINSKPVAVGAKEAIKPVSKKPHEATGVNEALKKEKINQSGLKPMPKKKDTRQKEKG